MADTTAPRSQLGMTESKTSDIEWLPVCCTGRALRPCRVLTKGLNLNSIRGNNQSNPDCGILLRRNAMDSPKMSISKKGKKLEGTILDSRIKRQAMQGLNGWGRDWEGLIKNILGTIGAV